MKEYVLDTDTFSHFRVGTAPVVAKVKLYRLVTGLSALTVEEALGGWYSLLRKSKTPEEIEHAYSNLGATTRALGTFPILTFSTEAQIVHKGLTKTVRNVGGFDLKIAAVALVRGAVVVTGNERDFSRVPGLVIENWLK